MLRSFSYSLAVVSILFFVMGITNNAFFNTAMAKSDYKAHKEHKAEEHGMTGSEDEKVKEKVEHEHKEVEKPKYKKHGEHEEEAHGMTGSEDEKVKEKVEHEHKEVKKPKYKKHGEHEEEVHGMTGSEDEKVKHEHKK